VRSEWPIDRLQVTAYSPIRTVVIMSMGGNESRVTLEPEKPARFDVDASGVRDEHSYAYLLSARSTEAFIPHLRDPSSTDPRNLGARLRFTAVPKK